MLLYSIGVNNSLPELVNTAYGVLNLLRGCIRLAVKGSISTINNSLI